LAFPKNFLEVHGTSFVLPRSTVVHCIAKTSEAFCQCTSGRVRGAGRAAERHFWSSRWSDQGQQQWHVLARQDSPVQHSQIMRQCVRFSETSVF